jgi:ribonucleoside-triphosphate reductase
MDLAKDSLEIKRKVIEKFTDDGLYPYSKHYLDNIYARFGSYWKNHFNTIGINGMNEATINLLGQDITTPEGHAFAAEMLDFMREKLMDYQNETNNLYNLEATPGEGCTYRFAKKDLEMYPEIIFANDQAVKHEGADPYYTNSSNLPVGFTDDLFSALDLQDDLQTKYTGGTVLHGYIGRKLFMVTVYLISPSPRLSLSAQFMAICLVSINIALNAMNLWDLMLIAPKRAKMINGTSKKNKYII